MEAIQITIPKPCHEDWNKMSPRQHGRYCNACNKTVLDFSAKSVEEIRQFFQANSNQNLCGRFHADQLKNPIVIEIPIQSLGNHLSATQAFLVSLLMVFGTTLFSCTSPNNEVVEKMVLTTSAGLPFNYVEDLAAGLKKTTVGKMRVTTPASNPFTNENDSANSPDHKIVKGEIVKTKSSGHPMAHEDNSATSIKKDSPDLKTGRSDLINAPEFPLQTDTIELPTAEVSDYAVPLLDGGYVTGCMVAYITDDAKNTSKKAGDHADTSLITKSKSKDIDVGLNENLVIYPNPATNFLNLKFNLESEKLVSAELVDMNGKIIRTLIPFIKMQEDIQDIQIQIEDLKPGTYLVQLMMDERVVSKRFVKL